MPSNDLGQVIHTHVPLPPSSIIWYQSQGRDFLGWEGNRRPGVALAIRHRLKWFIRLRSQGLMVHSHTHALLGWDGIHRADKSMYECLY